MTSVLDRFNLGPKERRLVVIVGLVVFVVLNLWLVWPNFGELGRVQQRIKDTRASLKKYQDEIDKQSTYLRELRELQGQGQFIANEEQALRLSQEVTSQAALSGVDLRSISPSQRTGRTNAFFDEQSLVITVSAGEKELVDFLFNLASKETLTRVRSMTLGPDPKRERLQGNITLVKSFQKKPPPKTTPAVVASAKPTLPAPPKAVTNVATAKPPPPAGVPPATKASTNVAVKAAGTNAPATTSTNKAKKKWYWPF